jgi:hypothetical protein
VIVYVAKKKDEGIGYELLTVNLTDYELAGKRRNDGINLCEQSNKKSKVALKILNRFSCFGNINRDY